MGQQRPFVIPAKAGIQKTYASMDSGFRRNDASGLSSDSLLADPRRNICNSLGCLAVPQLRLLETRPAKAFPLESFQLETSGANNPVFLRAGNNIRPVGHGKGTLGVLPQGDAWYSEDGSLLLNSTRIREDEARVCHELRRSR